MIFCAVTGVDPLTLPDREKAAMDLGIDPRVALGLRRVASEELKAAAKPRSPQVGAQLGASWRGGPRLEIGRGETVPPVKRRWRLACGSA